METELFTKTILTLDEIINKKIFYKDLLKNSTEYQYEPFKSSTENSINQLESDFDNLCRTYFSIDDLQKLGKMECTKSYLSKLKTLSMKPSENSPRVFVDMDGVLAVFDNQIESLEVLYEEGYFRNLKLQKNVVKGIREYVKSNPTNTFILSHYLDSPYAVNEKKQWLADNLPEIKNENIILVPYGNEKTNYIPGGIKSNDFLIDDFTKNLIEWKKCNGIGIKLVNNINDTNKTWQGVRLNYDDIDLYAKLCKYVSMNGIQKDTMYEKIRDMNDEGYIYLKNSIDSGALGECLINADLYTRDAETFINRSVALEGEIQKYLARDDMKMLLNLRINNQNIFDGSIDITDALNIQRYDNSIDMSTKLLKAAQIELTNNFSWDKTSACHMVDEMLKSVDESMEVIEQIMIVTNSGITV